MSDEEDEYLSALATNCLSRPKYKRILSYEPIACVSVESEKSDNLVEDEDSDSESSSSMYISEDSQDEEWWVYHYEERYRGPTKNQRRRRRRRDQSNAQLENMSDLVFTNPAAVQNETDQSFIGVEDNGRKLQRILRCREITLSSSAVPTLQVLCLHAHMRRFNSKGTGPTAVSTLPSGLRLQGSFAAYEREVHARNVAWHLNMCAHLNERLFCETETLVEDDRKAKEKRRASKRFIPSQPSEVKKIKRKCQFGMLCRTVFSFSHVVCKNEAFNEEVYDSEFSRSLATVHAAHRIGHCCDYSITEAYGLRESWFVELLRETLISTMHLLLTGFYDEDLYNAVVCRLVAQMNHRFPTLSKMALSTALPFVHWSQGKLDFAAQSALSSAEECRAAADKHDRNTTHRYCISLLNELGRMYATFGLQDDAFRFFHAATVEGLAVVSEEFCSTLAMLRERAQSESLATPARAPVEVAEESTEERKMLNLQHIVKLHQAALTAAFCDIGYLAGNVKKRATSVEHWKQALSVPNAPMRLAVHAAISAIFVHADNNPHWIRNTLGILEDLMSHSKFVQYYMSILHAMLGNEKSSFHFLRASLEQQVLNFNFIPVLSRLQPSSEDMIWWRPLLEHVSSSGSTLRSLRMIWRQYLCQPVLEGVLLIERDFSRLWQVAERCSEQLNLRLEECSAGIYLTADVAGSWPPIAKLTLNPWTGEHLILKECSRLSAWHNVMALDASSQRRNELAAPFRLALGHLTSCGSLVELFCAGECCTFDGTHKYDKMVQLHRNHKLRRGWMDLVLLSKTGCRRIDVFRLLDAFLLQTAENLLLADLDEREKKMKAEEKEAKIVQFKRIGRAMAAEGRYLVCDNIQAAMAKEDEGRAELAKLTAELKVLRSSKLSGEIPAVLKKIKELKEWLSGRKWLDFLPWSEYVLVDVSRVRNCVVLHISKLRRVHGYFWEGNSENPQISHFHVFVQLSNATDFMSPRVVKQRCLHVADWQNLDHSHFPPGQMQFSQRLDNPFSDIVALHVFDERNPFVQIYHINGTPLWDFEDCMLTFLSSSRGRGFFLPYLEFGGVIVGSTVFVVLQYDRNFPQLLRVVALEKDRSRRSDILPGFVRLTALCQASALVVFFQHGWSILNASFLEKIEITDDTVGCRAELLENNFLVPLFPSLTLGEGNDVSIVSGDERQSCFVAEERLLPRRFNSHVDEAGYIVQAAVVMRQRLWVVEVQLTTDVEVEEGVEPDHVFPLSTRITLLLDAVGRITEVKFVSSVCILVCCTPVPLRELPSFAGAELLCQYSWLDGTLMAVLPGLGNAPHRFLHAELPPKDERGKEYGGHMIYFADGHGAICALQLA